MRMNQIYSPFNLTTLEENGLGWEEEPGAEEVARNMTVDGLILELRSFHHAITPFMAKSGTNADGSWFSTQVMAFTSSTRNKLAMVEGLEELRSACLMMFGQDLDYQVAEQIKGVLSRSLANAGFLPIISAAAEIHQIARQEIVKIANLPSYLEPQRLCLPPLDKKPLNPFLLWGGMAAIISVLLVILILATFWRW